MDEDQPIEWEDAIPSQPEDNYYDVVLIIYV